MNTYYVAGIPFSDELFHHGVKGQKWGIRRYQNLDGTLTEAGKKRYSVVVNPKPYSGIKSSRNAQRQLNKLDQKIAKDRSIAQREYEKAKKIADKDTRKGYDMNSKRGLKDADKIMRMNAKSNSKALTAAANVKISKDIIDAASKAGYTITSRPVLRNVSTGKDIALTVLSHMGAIATASIVGIGFATSFDKYAPGTEYKVRDNKNSSITHS